MKTILKVAVIAISLVLMLVADIPLLPVRLLTVQLEWVPEAEAVMGRQRRTRRRGVAVGYTAGVEAGRNEAYQQQAAPPPQQAAPPPQQAAPAQQQPAAPPPQQTAPAQQ
jgi:hypothetical protein